MQSEYQKEISRAETQRRGDQLGFTLRLGVSARGFFLIVLLASPIVRAATDLKFSFGAAIPGATAVTPGDVYSKEKDFGYDLESHPDNGKPFFFSTKLDPGEYQVTVTLGDPSAETIA